MNIKNIKIKTLVAAAVFGFLAILAAHEYDRFPFGGHGEEQAFAWAGLSILKTGIPVSWSHFDYPKKNQIFKGIIGDKDGPNLGVILVKPYFDQPPLFAVVSALTSYFKGEKLNSILSASYVRLPSIAVFWLILVFIFIFAKKLFGFWLGLFSMAIFGTVPIFVFGGRMAVPEVFFALFYLLMLLSWMRYEKSKKVGWLLLIGAISGIAGLMKITGFLLLPLFIFFLIKKRKFKLSGLLLATQIPFVCYLLSYALNLDLGLFIKITIRQGFRPIGWSTLPYLFSSPGFDIYEMFDGWFVLSTLSVIYLLFSKIKNKEYLIWPLFYWLAVMIFTAGQQDMLPWYRYPMYPFLAISLALLIKDIFRKPSFFTILLLSGMLLSSRYYLVNAFHSDVAPGIFRFVFPLILAPSLLEMSELFMKINWRKINQMIVVLILALGIFYNVKVIYNMYSILCQSKTCTMGPSTKISTLYYPVIWRLFIYK